MNVIPPRRRGACPGLTAPMQTGDGLLVRIASQGVTVGLDAATALCAAARRHGNRIIEITARGNIQIRGLTPASAPTFADAVAALGIDGGDGVPILTDPLAGLEPLGRGGADSLPPCGGGSGWGVVPWGTEVTHHLATPPPPPPPPAGGGGPAAGAPHKGEGRNQRRRHASSWRPGDLGQSTQRNRLGLPPRCANNWPRRPSRRGSGRRSPS
jgi:hypothetical protein